MGFRYQMTFIDDVAPAGVVRAKSCPPVLKLCPFVNVGKSWKANHEPSRIFKETDGVCILNLQFYLAPKSSLSNTLSLNLPPKVVVVMNFYYKDAVKRQIGPTTIQQQIDDLKQLVK